MQFQDEHVQEAMKLAQSDAGKQLLALLRQTQGAQLQQAMDQAAVGDFDQVKKTMTSLLDTPEAKDLLRKMGR